MNVELTFSTPHPPRFVGSLIHELLESSPFSQTAPQELGSNQWRLTLTARRADMVVGFASVAELLLRLCHNVEIDSVVRINDSHLSIAS